MFSNILESVREEMLSCQRQTLNITLNQNLHQSDNFFRAQIIKVDCPICNRINFAKKLSKGHQYYHYISWSCTCVQMGSDNKTLSFKLDLKLNLKKISWTVWKLNTSTLPQCSPENLQIHKCHDKSNWGNYKSHFKRKV
jgi:hypothetical protein